MTMRIRRAGLGAVFGIIGGLVLCGLARGADPAPTGALTLPEMLQLATNLSKQKTAPESDWQLLVQVAGQSLAKQTPAGAWDWKTWSDLLVRLAPHASAEMRQTWVSQVRAGLAAGDGVGRLSYADIGSANKGISALGDTSAGNLIADWVVAANLQELTPDVVVSLGKSLATMKTGAAARTRLLGHVQTRWLGDAAAARSWAMPKWVDFVNALGKDLTAEQKGAWGVTLRQAFSAPAGVANLSPGDVQAGTSMLKRLGDPQPLAVLEAWTAAEGKLATLKSTEMLGLTALASGETAEAVALRKRFIGHVESTLLKDANTIKSLDMISWDRLVGQVEKDLTAEQKTSWAGSLRQALSAPASVSALTLKDVQTAGAALRRLGDPQALAVLDAWTAAGNMDALKPADLLTLATMANGDAAEALAVRRRLSQHVEAAMLKDAATSAGLPTWDKFVALLGKEFTAEQKTLWAGSLRQAFSAPAVAAALTLKDLPPAVSLLQRLGDAQALALIDAWATADRLQTLKPADLLALGALVNGESAEALTVRRRLSQHVETSLMKDANAVKAVELPAWGRLVDLLAEDLTAERKAAWVKNLRQAYAAPGTLGSLTLASAQSLKQTVQKLDDADPANILAQWVVQNASWHQMMPAQLLSLAASLREAKADRNAARQLVVEHVQATWLASPEAIRQVPAKAWRDLYLTMGEEQQLRIAVSWVARLRAAYLPAAESGELKFADICEAVTTLGTLHDPLAGDLLARHIVKQEEWRTADAEVWGRFAGVLADNTNAQAQAARARLIEHIDRTFAADAAAIQKVRLKVWRQFVRLVFDADPQINARWAKGLSAAYAPSEDAIASLSRGEVGPLVETLARLDAKSAGAVAWTWLRRSPQRSELPMPNLAALSKYAFLGATLTAEQSQALVSDMEKVWAAQNAQTPLGVDQALAMAEICLMAADAAKSQQWITKAYDLGVGTLERQRLASIHDLTVIAARLWLAGQTDKQEDYPALAAALAWKAKQGTLDARGRALDLAMAVKGTQARQTLQAELIGPDGGARLEVGRILAQTYREIGKFKEWQTLIDGKLAETAGNGDLQTTWLLVQGETDVLAPKEPNLKRKGIWLDKALAAARSEPVRLAVLYEYVWYFRQTHGEPTGMSLLDSVMGQFGPETQLRVQSWRSQLAVEHQRQLDYAERARIVGANERHAALLEHYEQSLERARAARNALEVIRLQALITDLQRNGVMQAP